MWKTIKENLNESKMIIYVVISTCLVDEVSCKCLIDCVTFATSNKYKHILVIDDTPEDGIDIYQLKFPSYVKIIKNQYKKSGEITRIWYFWKYAHKGDYGILIHDSTFINTHIPIFKYDFIPLFSFEHIWDDTRNEKSFFKEYPKLLKMYNEKNKWKGCFGVQYEITWDFVDKVMKTYPDLFEELLSKVKTRNLRSCMERVIQVIFLSISSNTNESIYGTIHDYTTRYYGKSFGVDYNIFHENELYSKQHMPIIKVWVGR